MQIGYIYKITNLINGKIYIGQTSKTIEERFRHHKMDSIREDKESYNYPLYRAFRKYGIENFQIEKVENCDIDKLNEREIYWISYYDSFDSLKGYNQTLGGKGKRILNLDEQEVISKYNETKNIFVTANFFNCSNASIREILLKNNVEIISAIEHAKEKGISIERIDINSGKILGVYKTLHDAGQWVLDNNLSNAKSNKNCAIGIRYAIIKDSFAYGFKWNSNDVSLNELKELYKKEPNKIKIPEINKKIEKINKFSNVCPICGIKIDKESSMCRFCYNNEKSKDSFKDLEEKILKETLMQLVRDKSFIEIGNLYNVSDNTIRKWCQKYLIPFRKEDINNISDEDWIKECNLTKKEYESKYCVKKEKQIISDEEIIKSYKELKTLKAVCLKYHKDIKTIKNILNKNSIEIIDYTDKVVHIERLDKDTLEVLEKYSSIKDVLKWIYKNIDTNAKEESLKASFTKACKNNSNFYGYKWRKNIE